MVISLTCHIKIYSYCFKKTQTHKVFIYTKMAYSSNNEDSVNIDSQTHK